MAYRPIQTEFADDERVVQVGQHLAGGRHDAEGDREVVSRALFAEVRRGQVDGQAVLGVEEAAVGDGGANPFPTFAHSGAGQSDNCKSFQSACNIYFDFDRFGVQADDRAASHSR